MASKKPNDWHKVSDVKAFLAAKGNRRSGPHAFTKKTLHWPYCKNCGLLLLKNEATREAARAKCVWED